jgi:FixJ family two-component response regulator
MAKGAIELQPIVLIVDDDSSICEALSNLFRSVGLRVEVISSAVELMKSTLLEVSSCLVLDIRLPNLSGLDLQTELAQAGIPIPVIVMTGHGDIPMVVRAMRAGAVDFLTKPFRDQDMLDAVATAIERDRKRRNDEENISSLRVRFRLLTPREREVVALLAAGCRNKQIATEIGLVKVPRRSIMRKMGARTLADLVRMAEVMGVHRVAPQHVQSSV